MLRRALQQEPRNTEVLLALLELTSGGRRPRDWRGSLRSLRYPLCGGLLFIGSLGLALAPLVFVARSLASHLDRGWGEGLGLGVILGAALVVLLASVALGVYLFLWLWFSFVRRLPAPERQRAEGRLAQALNLPALEPAYSQMRRRMLGRGREGDGPSSRRTSP